MNLCFISTIDSFNEISKKGDMLFCLAPYIKNNKAYRENIQVSWGEEYYSILDNGVAEDNLISNDELVNMAIKLGMSEIIVPDTIGDYDETKRKREEFLDNYYTKLKEHDIKIQSVIQGSTLKEYKDALEEVREDERIDVVGIPFRMNYCKFNDGDELNSAKNHAKNRVLFVEAYYDIIDKPIHLLGLNVPWELLKLNELVRSCDTKYFARCGLSNYIFNWNDKKKPEKKLYLNEYMSDEQMETTIKNINKLKKYISS